MPRYPGVTPAPPRPSKRSRHVQEPAPVVPPPFPFLPNEVILGQILTRVPAAALVRFRAVCREWRAALTSDHFVQAHQAVVRARAGAQAQPPEIVFFAPAAAAGSTTTSFYTSRLRLTPSITTAQQDAVHELVAVGDMRADDLVMSSTKPCRGLSLLFQPSSVPSPAYHVCNLSTGEHVSLPPCPRPRRMVPYGPYVLSSAGLGFDPASNQHKVVRLFEDDTNWQPRCEVYGLRSGGCGWRPCAGPVPSLAPKGLCGRPPVFVDGHFYWHMHWYMNFSRPVAMSVAAAMPEPILSLSVDTEQFRWVHAPEQRARYAFRLADLDGALCAVVDTRAAVEHCYDLWTLAAGGGGGSTTTTTPPWTLRCRISLASLPRPMSDALRAGYHMLPLGSVPGGREILLATSRHEVYRYDPESNRADRVFSANDFVDTLTTTRESVLLLNVAIHEEWVTPVICRHPTPRGGGGGDDDVGKLKMELGNNRTVVAKQGERRGRDAIAILIQMFCLHQRNPGVGSSCYGRWGLNML